MDSTYGITVLPQGDPYVETAEHALSAASAAGNPGSYFVDVLPICECRSTEICFSMRLILILSPTSSKIYSRVVPRGRVSEAGSSMESVCHEDGTGTVGRCRELYGMYIFDTLVSPSPDSIRSYAQDRARPCAARIVLDSPLYQNAPDPRYIGDVIRDALGSMYGGTLYVPTSFR